MKDLLFSITKKDLRIEYFSGTGAGGQYRNKHQNCVRLHHDDSGAMVTGQSQRDRKANVREALENLIKHPKYRLWSSMKVQECLTGKTLDQIVDELMRDENLKIEIFVNGNWVEEKNYE